MKDKIVTIEVLMKWKTSDCLSEQSLIKLYNSGKAMCDTFVRRMLH